MCRYSTEWLLLKFQKIAWNHLWWRTTLVKLQVFIPRFYWNRTHTSEISEELFLCNTSRQLFLNLPILIVPASPACLTCIWKNGGRWEGVCITPSGNIVASGNVFFKRLCLSITFHNYRRFLTFRINCFHHSVVTYCITHCRTHWSK